MTTIECDNALTRAPLKLSFDNSLEVDIYNDCSEDEFIEEISQDPRSKFRRNVENWKNENDTTQIKSLRVSYEREKRRFHYREKQQHRKLQKWINKKLWNIDRLERKDDYRPKVHSFSSIVQEIPVKKILKKDFVMYDSSDSDVPSEGTKNVSNVGLDNVHNMLEEFSEESYYDEESTDGSSEVGDINVVTSITHDLDNLSKLQMSELSMGTPFSYTPTEARHNYALRESVDPYNFDDESKDHVEQIMAIFKYDYHGEDDEGIQL